MFKMGGGQTVGGNDGPFVLEDAHLGLTHVDHGFDGERHPWFEDRTGAAFAEIWNLGFFMKVPSDAVADKFTDHGVAVADCVLLDVGANVSESATGLDELDGTIQNLFCYGEKAFGLGLYDSDRNAHGRVADPAVPDDPDIHLHDVAVSNLSRSSDSVDHLFID